MARGETIFKRKNGRWEARYRKERDPSGRIRYGFCYGKTYREAKEKVGRAKSALAAGGPPIVPGKGDRLAYYCDEWALANRHRWKESTFVRYRTILERYVKPKLGLYPPQSITLSELSAFSEDLFAEYHLSSKTIRDILSTLHGVLKYFAREQPGVYACTEFIYPKVPKTEARVLTVEEENRLLGFLTTDMDACKFGVALALLTGMRIGELCALKWENVSLTENTVRVTASMQRVQTNNPQEAGKTKIVVSRPKSEKSVRVIPLSPLAGRLCGQMAPQAPGAYVLTGTSDYMEPRMLQYRFAAYSRACGLEQVHFHTLRHTFATRCAEAGFDVKSLSEILGHATTAITLERYVHATLEQKMNDMKKLEALGL